MFFFFFFKQKTAYEMRISDWSSDVCSSDLGHPLVGEVRGVGLIAAVELVADKESRKPFDPLGSVGGAVYERAHEHGLIVRGIQDSIAFCPPQIGRASCRERVCQYV